MGLLCDHLSARSRSRVIASLQPVSIQRTGEARDRGALKSTMAQHSVRGLAALRALPVASIFLALLGLAVAGHCPVLRTTAHVDWSAIAGKYWLEIATHPAIPQCTVRVYYPRRAVMMWYQTNGYGGVVTKKRQYSFLLHNDVQLLQRNGQFFQQILDTDNQSWALVHVCSTNDGISKILFTTLEPWNMIPVEIQQRITMALHTAGLPELPLIQSNCVPHRELVPYYSY